MTGALLALLAYCSLLAWLRVYRADGEVFGGAEVIAVVRLRPGSVRMLPWAPGGLQEYAATLEVTEILKGPGVVPELTVVLHHGLTPVVGGYLREGNVTIDCGHRRAGVIEIYDTGSSAVSGVPVVADAREDHVWFLGRHPGLYNEALLGPAPTHAGLLGVAEPDEIRPLAEREAVVRWLAANS